MSAPARRPESNLHCRKTERYFSLSAKLSDIRTLSSWSRLSKKLPGKSFQVIAGKFADSAYYAAVQGVVAQKPDRIRMYPFYVEDKDFQIYLNAADCVVLPYTEILTSGAVMLSLSFGKPVIAPRLGCLEEVISQCCGRLYDTTVQNGLLEAMASFDAGDFDCTRILSEARKYSWDRSAATFIEACNHARRKRRRKQTGAA